MNPPDLPLDPEQLDELLNADLDGEFDRAATDLGFTPDSARAAVRGTPEADRRRDALLRARALSATPPPFGADDELRLVTNVLMHADDLRDARNRHETRRRRETTWRVLVAVGSAAAVIAVIVGLAGVNTGNDAKSSSASFSTSPERAGVKSAAPAAKPKKLQSVAFGVVPNANALRTRASAAIKVAGRLHSAADRTATTMFAGDSGIPGVQGPSGALETPGAPGPVVVTGPTGADGPSVTGATGAAAPGTSTQSGVEEGKSVDEGLNARGADGLLAMAAPRGLVGNDGVVVNAPAATPAVAAPLTLAPVTARRCVAVAIHTAGPGSTRVVTGSATYAARPAAVVILRRATAYVAYVLTVPACSVITHVSVP